MWGVFVDNDGHKRGQTSRPVIGAEIQTYCYFEAHIYRRRYLLGSIQCRCFMLHVRLPYIHLVWPYSYTIMPRYLSCVVHKSFCALSHHHTQIQDHVQQQPSQPNAMNTTQYKKAVYSALWVQLALVVCYLPYHYGLVEIAIRQSKTYSSHQVITGGVASTVIYFNSTLNPFLYCWKISEVRQAVKQTIRQVFSCP